MPIAGVPPNHRREHRVTVVEGRVARADADRPADEAVEDRAAEDGAGANGRLAEGQAEGHADIAAQDFERGHPKGCRENDLHVHLHAATTLPPIAVLRPPVSLP